MAQTQHTQFSGTIPALYDRHLGPVIFEPYARDMASRVPTHEGVRVLETAAGTAIDEDRHFNSQCEALVHLLVLDRLAGVGFG